MRGLSVVVSLLACWCAGCLSSDAPAAKAWTLDAAPSAPAAGVLEGAGKAAFTTTRVGAVSVDAPYDKTPFVVRRADGSVAFDHYNVFAASPAALLRAPVRSRIGATAASAASSVRPAPRGPTRRWRCR